jgi:AcrR family transcriptional regulator
MSKTRSDGAATIAEVQDGRRQRSERSRAQIIDALFSLLQEGDFSPSASKVAERAEVGLRTVFRHFEDMDSLYGEMADRIMAKVMPIAFAPLTTTGWRAQFFELIDRRIEIYEHVFPIRVSANVRRFQSQFLMEEYRRNLVMERASLQSVLPEKLKNDETLFAAIEVVSGFQTWRRLRMDQDLERDDARGVVVLTLNRLLGP